jgi:hypothetical protein
MFTWTNCRLSVEVVGNRRYLRANHPLTRSCSGCPFPAAKSRTSPDSAFSGRVDYFRVARHPFRVTFGNTIDGYLRWEVSTNKTNAISGAAILRGRSMRSWISASAPRDEQTACFSRRHYNQRPNGATVTGSNASLAIFRIGLISGTLDITESIIFNAFRHITPTMIFQYIASGLIDGASFELGLASVALGIVLHYLIALTWTAIFFVASRRLAVLTRRPVTAGLLYGLGVYLFMNLLVLPMSRIPRSEAAMTLPSRISGILAVTFCIGLTISLLVRRRQRRCPITAKTASPHPLKSPMLRRKASDDGGVQRTPSARQTPK